MERGVKSRADRKGQRLRPLLRTSIGAFATLTYLGLRGEAEATKPQRRATPFLLGGSVEVHRPQVQVDPLLPPGEIRDVGSGPPPAHIRCSLRRSVCVAGEAAAPARSTLELLERAFEEVTLGFSLSAPALGPSRDPLVWEPGAPPLTVTRLGLPSLGFDRASVTCTGGTPDLATARRCASEAAIFRQAPATASWLTRGFGSYAAWILSGDDSLDESLNAAQQHPEEGLLPRTDDARVAIFLDHLGAASRAPLEVTAPAAALQIAATKTPPDALRWEAEPDLMDVLRRNLDADRNRLARHFDALSAARFTRSSRLLARARGPSEAWEVTASSLPRNLVLPTPLLPTGSSYVRVRLDASKEARLALRTFCEPPVSYVWSFLALDAQDRVLRHVPVAFQEQAPQVTSQLGDLGEVSSVVIVGTNLGGVDLAHPFDPDHGPHEGHACQVALDLLPPSNASAEPRQRE